MDSAGLTLGVNGFGRIGKLTVWHHVARKYFDEIVVNIGREAGTSLADIAHYIERDSTYGWLHGYLYGHNAEPVVSEINADRRHAPAILADQPEPGGYRLERPRRETGCRYDRPVP